MIQTMVPLWMVRQTVLQNPCDGIEAGLSCDSRVAPRLLLVLREEIFHDHLSIDGVRDVASVSEVVP